MSNSSLVSYTHISPNCNVPRKYAVSKITPHHMAGWLSLEEFGALVARSSRQMSANYAIDKNGNIGLFCDEANRSWCSSSPANDHRAITIEVANDGGASTNWHVSDASMEALVKLCVDICQRNAALNGGLNYTGDARGNLTMHQYFAATACPGPYLKGKFAWLAQEVNSRLAGGTASADGTELRAGMALHLDNTPLYVSSTSTVVAAMRSGTYYLWGTEVVNDKVRITNSTSNVGKKGAVTGWIAADDAKTAAGIKDQTDDTRGLYTLEYDGISNAAALTLMQLAQELDLTDAGYYRSKYADDAHTKQNVQIGQISAGDAATIRAAAKVLGLTENV